MVNSSCVVVDCVLANVRHRGANRFGETTQLQSAGEVGSSTHEKR
jgi:hypothetical protein